MMIRRVRLAVLPLLSLFLIFFLLYWSGLTVPTVIQAIGGLSPVALACIVALTFANLSLGTLKWLFVLRSLSLRGRSLPPFVDAMVTTTAGALLGQIMPVQLGIALARSTGGQMGIGCSSRVNFGTTVYEQLFDGLALCVASIIGLIGMALSPGYLGWALLTLTCGFVGIAAAVPLPWLLRATSILLARKLATRRQYRPLSGFGIAVERTANLPNAVSIVLTVLSILRYITVLLRVLVVLSALQMSRYAGEVVTAFPLLQTIGFAPITPGNLGVIDWTWSAVFVSAGATIRAGALFALVIRTVTVCSICVLLAALVAFHFSDRLVIVWCWMKRWKSAAIDHGPQRGPMQ